MGQFKDMFMNIKGTVIDDFGNTIVPGELIGFRKTIGGIKTFIWGKYDYMKDGKLCVVTHGYKTDKVEDLEILKKKIKGQYMIKEKSIFYKMTKKS